MGQSPPGSTYNEEGRGIPFFQGVKDFSVRYPQKRVFCTAPTRFAEPGDILFSVRAPIGEINRAYEQCAIGRGLAAIRGNTLRDTDYIEYALRSIKHEWRILENQGAVFGNAKRSDLENLPIPWPDEKERHAIAHILGTLDDKIELNRRMNETLEAMAQALFKSWFVDFDPVVVNAIRAGNPIPEKFAARAAHYRQNPNALGLPDDILRLFPARFVDSELGPIPEGWGVGPLNDFFSVGLGGAWGEGEPSARATVAVRCLRGIDCHDLAEGRIPDVPVRWLSPKQVADRELMEGAILIEGSGSFCGRSMIWRRGYEALLGAPVGYSNFCKRLDPGCTPAQAAICWMQIRQAYRDGMLQSFRTGTAFPNFDVHGFLSNLIVVVPPLPLAEAFGEIFALSQRLDLMAQSRTLTALRDALLPRLISGELRVPDVEKIMEDG